MEKRLSAVCNVFGNATPTLYGLGDARYIYHIDRSGVSLSGRAYVTLKAFSATFCPW